MSTNVEGINYATASVLGGLTTPGGISYVLAWDTTNLYLRFFDGVTAGGRRLAFYGDLPGTTEPANLVYAGPASGAAAAAGFRPLILADLGFAGSANGVATLDGTAKIPIAQLPAAVTGSLSYQGVWNAASNTPALSSGSGTKGAYYKVQVAGSSVLDGIGQWNVGDVAVFDGTAWDKLDGVSSEVLSFNGRTGAVALGAADITAAIGYTPLNPANNLSDVAAPATARLNLSPARVVSGTATLTAADYTIFADASSGAVSLTLPPTPAPGQEIRVKDHRGASYTNTITVSAAGGVTIDGQSSWVINVNFAANGFVWNGTQWSVF